MEQRTNFKNKWFVKLTVGIAVTLIVTAVISSLTGLYSAVKTIENQQITHLTKHAIDSVRYRYILDNLEIINNKVDPVPEIRERIIRIETILSIRDNKE